MRFLRPSTGALLRAFTGRVALNRPAFPSNRLPKTRALSNAPSLEVNSRPSCKNHIGKPITDPDVFATEYVKGKDSISKTRPVLTLWTSSKSAASAIARKHIYNALKAGIGEMEGGVSFCEINCDAPKIKSFLLTEYYKVNYVPALMAFDHGRARKASKVEDSHELVDRHFVEDWIREEAWRFYGGTLDRFLKTAVLTFKRAKFTPPHH